MKRRYRLYRRNAGVFYSFDKTTGKRESLQTFDHDQATSLIDSKNEAHEQQAFNRQKAQIYFCASDPHANTRTWKHVMEEITKTKHGETRERYERAFLDKALKPLTDIPLVKTSAEAILGALENGTVATNVFLRRLHNFALRTHWLPQPLLYNQDWPKVRYQDKRAITFEEHQKIIAREKNAERKAFYELCWHLGGSQGDIASLQADDIDWHDRTIAYARKKTETPALLHFGDTVAEILQTLPEAGALFPYLIRVRASDRATEFKQRCTLLGITGVTLHSYRYAWAERAKTCGYPERFAQQALGHNSKAVHRAYAKKALVKLPSLEEFEKKIIPLSKIA